MDNKENNLQKKNRLRGENWTQEEKDLFLEVMAQSAPIIESKLTDTNNNKRNNLEWAKIQNKLRELTGKSRDIAQLKGFWRRGKVAAKKNVSQHRRALQTTGGGQPPSSPLPDDLKIMSMCSTDFVVDKNLFDSDAVLIGQNDVDSMDISQNTIYDTEGYEDRGIDLEKYCEIVTIAKVHHSNDTMEPKPTNALNKKNIDQEKDSKEIVTIAEVHGLYSNDKEPKANTPNKKKNIKPKPNTSKAAIVQANIGFKNLASQLMENEYKLKMQYQKEELNHQKIKHKLEIEILQLEKESKLTATNTEKETIILICRFVTQILGLILKGTLTKIT